MNAVERLLAHGEQVLSLFDEMFIDRIGSGRPVDLPESPCGSPAGLLYAVGHFVIDAMPPGQYWSSGAWLQAAVEAAWEEMKSKEMPTRQEVGARAAELFHGYLTQREQLLTETTWRRLLADVVFESRAWEPLAARVVSLAEDVAKQVRSVEQVSGDVEPLLWEREERVGLRAALDSLHPYAQPPKPASLAANGEPGGKQRKRRDRKGVGGRPEKFSLNFIRDVVAARERDEKRAAIVKKPVPPVPQWLRDYCDSHDIDIRERFPAATPGEEWSIRANRFWKAAKKRLRDGGN